jgi:hypothetical protein
MFGVSTEIGSSANLGACVAVNDFHADSYQMRVLGTFFRYVRSRRNVSNSELSSHGQKVFLTHCQIIGSG